MVNENDMITLLWYSIPYKFIEGIEVPNSIEEAKRYELIGRTSLLTEKDKIKFIRKKDIEEGERVISSRLKRDKVPSRFIKKYLDGEIGEGLLSYLKLQNDLSDDEGLSLIIDKLNSCKVGDQYDEIKLIKLLREVL